jgi:hypothetical protein
MEDPLLRREISAETPEERLEELRSLSQDDIMQKYGPKTTFSPLGDGKFLLLHGASVIRIRIAAMWESSSVMLE